MRTTLDSALLSAALGAELRRGCEFGATVSAMSLARDRRATFGAELRAGFEFRAALATLDRARCYSRCRRRHSRTGPASTLRRARNADGTSEDASQQTAQSALG